MPCSNFPERISSVSLRLSLKLTSSHEVGKLLVWRVETSCSRHVITLRSIIFQSTIHFLLYLHLRKIRMRVENLAKIKDWTCLNFMLFAVRLMDAGILHHGAIWDMLLAPVKSWNPESDMGSTGY